MSSSFLIRRCSRGLSRYNRAIGNTVLKTSFSNSNSAICLAATTSSSENYDNFHQFKVAITSVIALGLCGATISVSHSDEAATLEPATVSDQPPLPKKDNAETTLAMQYTRDCNRTAHGIKIFTGNSNKPLAKDIADHLGMGLGKVLVGRFADGEVNVVINENVRGKDVYIIQPTTPPTNETLMELLLMISTMRRASARKITAVIPYYGYARQDRKMQARVPISAADVARLLEAMGVDRVVAVDLHCGQIQGFFGPRVPVDNLDGGTVGVSYFGDMDLVNPVIVSPDAGGVYRAKQFREALKKKHEVDCGLAMIVKQRAKANEIERMDLVGSVEGCDAIIVDDMVDTAGTLCQAAEMLKQSGARRVFAFASHGVFSGPAASRIANSVLTELVVLDTIPLSPEASATGKITQLSVGPLLAQAIYNIHNKKSISALFK
eukprot:gene3314-6564_t